MARTARGSKLDTPTARSKLAYDKSGYWISIAPGRGFGYRKGPKGSKWLARIIIDGKRFEKAIGTPDDILDANDQDILSFAQAQAKAREWYEIAARPDIRTNPSTLTVNDAVASYMADYKGGKTKGGGSGWRETETTVNAYIIPELGHMKVMDLTRNVLEQWRDAIATSPPRRRTNRGKKPRHANIIMDAEAIRKRRNTSNRVLNNLRAILNHACDQNGLDRRSAWTGIKSFRNVNAPRVRWLKDIECKNVILAASPDLRALMSGALMTGARLGELTNLKVADVDLDQKTVFISKSKSGKPRYIFLSDEGATLFAGWVKDKAHDDNVFKRSNGALWKHSDQQRGLATACEKANIQPAVGFHILRHTYASRLAMKGVNMNVIAAQLGHADTRITEKHYAHLCPNYVASTFRAAFDSLGLWDSQIEPEDTADLADE